jgi:hypothetical protein
VRLTLSQEFIVSFAQHFLQLVSNIAPNDNSFPLDPELARKKAELEEKQANEQFMQDDSKLFNELLRGATDTKSLANQRISFIWSLLPYWNSTHDIVLANTLATMIVYDPDRGVILNCAEVIGRAYESANDEKSVTGLRRLLYGIAGGSIGIVPRCQHQIVDDYKLATKNDPKTDPNRSALYDARIEASGQAIRKSWKNLKEINLDNAILNKMPLYEAQMDGASLKTAELNGADLYMAHLTGAHLEAAHLRKASLRGAILADTHLEGSDFHGADLRRADFAGAHIAGADFSGAMLSNLEALKLCIGACKGQPIVDPNYPEREGTPCDWPDWPTQ